MFPIQQYAKQFFYVFVSLPDQLFHQTITAGVGPVSGNFSFIQEIQDRPGIVNIGMVSKGETIIPTPYLFFPV